MSKRDAERLEREELVLVFARLPEEGRVKTRLVPHLGAARATALYRRVAEHVARACREAARERRTLVACAEPAARAAEVAAWLGEGFVARGQVQGDLGERMGRAFEEAFEEGAERVVVVGTDCPGFEARHLDEAFEALRRQHAVVGPALDGGYWLLGLPRPLPLAFREVPWSSPDTLAVTRRRLDEAGCRVHELETLRDLDDAEDYEALAGEYPERLGLEG